MADFWDDDSQNDNNPAVASNGSDVADNPVAPAPPAPTPRPSLQPQGESPTYYETPAPVEKPETQETAPNPVAPRPKALDEDPTPAPIPSRSSGRTVDTRSQTQVESITTIGDLDPTTAYADREETTFIQGVKEEHGSSKS